MTQQLWALWAQGSPLLGVWVALNEEGAVVGHLVATVQSWDGELVGWIHQLESDVPVPRAWWDELYRQLGQWLQRAGQSLGTTLRRCFMVTRTPEFFERRGGWRREVTLMSRRF